MFPSLVLKSFHIFKKDILKRKLQYENSSICSLFNPRNFFKNVVLLKVKHSKAHSDEKKIRKSKKNKLAIRSTDQGVFDNTIM